MRRKYRQDPKHWAELSTLLKDIYKEFGWKTRLIAPVVGSYLLAAMKMEERRLSRGWTLEPVCFYEQNQAARRLAKGPRTERIRDQEKAQWTGEIPSPAMPAES